ncbi:hypothetical protein [Bifidobacterium catenulatum]|uniref:hypothetical protein n=1 Tax=Bifidobacterium catenulatum TaxID=1686 RepID=UPI00321B456F
MHRIYLRGDDDVVTVNNHRTLSQLVVAAVHPVWHLSPKKFDDTDNLLDEATAREA